MKRNNTSKESRKVTKATRDAVIAAAQRMQLLKLQTIALARKAGNKWEGSKPQQQKAKDAVKKAASRIVDFERSVREGLKQGLAEVKKGNKKR